MNISNKEKKALLIVAGIVIIPVIIGIIAIKEEKDCLKNIEADGAVVIGYMTRFYIRSNTYDLEATIYYDVNGVKYPVSSPTLVREFPRMAPVYVKYSKSSPECVQVLMDSTVNIGTKKIIYFEDRNHGWDYKIEKSISFP